MPPLSTFQPSRFRVLGQPKFETWSEMIVEPYSPNSRPSKMAEARLRVERGVFRSPQTRRLREGRDFSGLAVLRTLSIYPDKFPKPTDTATDTVICFKFQGQWQRVRIAAVCNRVRKRLSWW